MNPVLALLVCVAIPAGIAGEPLPGNDLPIVIGADQRGGSPFRGRIGLVRLWNRALTEAQLRRLAASPNQPAGGVGTPAAEWDGRSGALPLRPGLDACPALGEAATVEAWVQPASGGPGGGRIVDRITPGGSDGWLLDTWPGSALRVIVGGSTLQTAAALPADAWTHVAATLTSAGEAALFLNGRPADGPPPAGEPGVAFVGEAPPPAGDLTAWYRRPAAAWIQAIPLGNGRMGAMLYGGVRQERLSLNEQTLWSGEPGDTMPPGGPAAVPEVRRLLREGKEAEAEALTSAKLLGPYFASYLPMGDLAIDFGQATRAERYRRELDLAHGVARVTYGAGGAHWTREAFVSHPARALVYRVACAGGKGIDLRVSLTSPLRGAQAARGADLVFTGQAPSFMDAYNGAPTRYDESGMRFEMRLRTLTEGGRVTCTDEGVRVTGARSVAFILVAATSYNGPQKSPSKQGLDPKALNEATLTRLSGKGYAALLAEHRADFAGLMGRVALDLGRGPGAALPTDERLRRPASAREPGLAALYYQFGRYLLASSSRPGGLPMNLQGLWCAQLPPPWASNWTLNCNAQINYWPAETANLSECHLPLTELARGISVDGARVARELYGAGGWMTHHNADVWMRATPVAGSPLWAVFQTGSAWLCRHLWEHYDFTRDRAYLASVFPLMAGACRYYLGTMLEDPVTGRLGTAPATNFESYYRKPNGETGCVCIGPTADMQMVRQLFKDTLRAAEVLGGEAELTAQIRAILPRVAVDTVSPRTGQIQAWMRDWDYAHAGNGQMLTTWGLICGDQVAADRDPVLAAALLKEIDDRKPWLSGLGSWTGAFMSNAFARLWQGDRALDILSKHLRSSVNPNLSARFAGMADWEIDGNMGQAAAIGEMLLQSHAGSLHLLPALPSAWPRGSVRGLRARGGFEAAMAWSGGKLRTGSVLSHLGGPCTVRAEGVLSVRRNGRAVPATQLATGMVRFETEPGATYTLEVRP